MKNEGGKKEGASLASRERKKVVMHSVFRRDTHKAGNNNNIQHRKKWGKAVNEFSKVFES